MRKTDNESAELKALVRLLDKTTRVMQTMSMRLDVMAFGQQQCMQRIAALEHAAVKQDALKKRAAERR
jgi:hypothetical protein